MPLRPVDPSLDLVALERGILDRWARDDVFAESLRRREGSPEWVFYEGPPTANGRPGIHHVWARLFKDLYPRFHTMRGKYVARKGGWDCHGLPVEVEVEKELGFSGKPEIERYGIERFNAACRASVTRYVDAFAELTTRIGMWLDTDDAYWTLSNEFIESVWWQFHRIWERELVYEGFKVVPYCSRCGTALSSHELGQPGAYRELTEPSVYVRFPLVDDDVDLLVWTTTPWTLPANVGVAIGEHIDYVRVRAPGGGRDLVVAAGRVEPVLGADAVVVGPYATSQLVDRGYNRPFTDLPLAEGGARVVAAEFVALDDGSGIVHLAPAFGEIDREVGERAGLPILNPVDAEGRFTDDFARHAGTWVKDADPALIDELAASGRLVLVEQYTHSYPHCWRCGTPLIYWAKPTWFANTSGQKAALLRENETIDWHPAHIKHGRFGDWLENNVDWALSRDRYWGTPIPVWRCDDCRLDTCVESVADLAERSGRDLSGLDLHRPFVDEITFPCRECSGTARRVEPVLDAWFDSGSMPAAQHHYPFEHTERFEQRFPADFVCEAIDQTRGWFYSLLAVNTLVFDRAPYRNVVCLALIVDSDGQKMSKSKGNVIDPWSVLDTRGADALRWNMFSAGSPWTPKRVSPESIDESTRRFLVTVWNTYSFFTTYARLDGWEPPTGAITSEPVHVLDRWARSRLHATVRAVTDALDSFDALAGAQAMERFVDDLSNWYVRRSRSRFWKSSDPAAHATLHECLSTLAQILAPFCPFVSDEIYTNLVDGESVHLTDWPAVDESAIDPTLDDEMELARALVSLGRAARTDARLKVRQPLGRAFLLLPADRPLSDAVLAEIGDELNVRALEIVHDLEGLLDYEVVPNFRALGPRVGRQMPAVKAALAAADGGAVRRTLHDDGVFRIVVEGDTLELGPDDVEVRARSHEELALAQEGVLAVALDTALTDELVAEGTAREVVRFVNDQRKAAGFELDDRITIAFVASGRAHAAISAASEWIAGEVLATDVTIESGDASGEQVLELDSGERVAARVERVARS